MRLVFLPRCWRRARGGGLLSEIPRSIYSELIYLFGAALPKALPHPGTKRAARGIRGALRCKRISFCGGQSWSWSGKHDLTCELPRPPAAAPSKLAYYVPAAAWCNAGAEPTVPRAGIAFMGPFASTEQFAHPLTLISARWIPALAGAGGEVGKCCDVRPPLSVWNARQFIPSMCADTAKNSVSPHNPRMILYLRSQAIRSSALPHSRSFYSSSTLQT